MAVRFLAGTWLALVLPISAWAQSTDLTSKDKPVRFPAAKAHAPSPLPDRVILTWDDDPSTTQAVTWRTDTSVASAVAQIAPSESGPGFAAKTFDETGAKFTKVRTFPARSVPFKSDLGEALYHSVRFPNLAPKSKYVYRVGDGTNWSEWFQFETAASTRDPAPLKFIYFGDAQNDLKQHWSRVARGAFSAMPDAKFVLHAGDLVDRGTSDEQWGEWFQAAGWINGMVPSVPVPGNHEYVRPPKPKGKSEEKSPGESSEKSKEKPPSSVLTPHWRTVFTLPENGPPGLEETAYHLDIHGVRFIAMNSNELQAEQIPWVENLLANNPCRWTVICFHHPIYSTARGRDNKKLREQWRPTFDKYGVDLVLQGHDHGYGRSGLMREDNLLSGLNLRDRGTVYVVSVSGPKMYSVERRDWMMSTARETQLYQLISIDGDRLHYESRTARGDLHDEFELRKRQNAGNELVEQAKLAYERDHPPSVSFLTGSQSALAVGGMVVLALAFAGFRMSRKPTRENPRDI